MLATAEKQGRTGRLAFVTIGHQIEQGGQVAVEERQDIVYRAMADGAAPDDQIVEPVPLARDERDIDVSPSLLRFSALTYNAHRIHYDRDYAQAVEAYPGLVTHGPLQAIVMAEAARARGVTAAPGLTFDYRLIAPLFDRQGMVSGAVAEGRDMRTAVRDRAGRRTATGLMTAP